MSSSSLPDSNIPRSNSIRSRRNPGTGCPLPQPQGARPKASLKDIETISTSGVTSSVSPKEPLPRQARALPSVPSTNSARPHPAQHSRDIRPLPFCPPLSIQNPQFSSSPASSSPASSSSTSSSSSSTSSSSTSPSSNFSTPSSSTSTASSFASSNIASAKFEHDDPVKRIEVLYPMRYDVNTTSKDDESTGTAESIQRVDTNLSWLAKKKKNPSHNSATKWVLEKDDRRTTVRNYDHVLQILRAL